MKKAGHEVKEKEKKKTKDEEEKEKEVMHMGFAPYRRMSRHLVDVGVQSGRDELLGGKNRNAKLKTPSGTTKNFKPNISKKFHKHSEMEKIQFLPEEEVKEYMVQPRAYKGSVARDPYGLDILQYADHLWLESARSSSTSENMPAAGYQFNVFDDSEQRILFIRPLMYDDTKPVSFVVISAVGVDLCKIQFHRPYCCSSSLLQVDIVMGNTKVSSMDFNGSAFQGYGNWGHKLTRANLRGMPKCKFRLCACRARPFDPNIIPEGADFHCEVYAGPQRKFMGTIWRNGNSMTQVVRGEPGGFYFIATGDFKSSLVAFHHKAHPGHTPSLPGSLPVTPDLSQIAGGSRDASINTGLLDKDSNSNLYKLHIITVLLILMVHFVPEVRNHSVSTNTSG